MKLYKEIEKKYTPDDIAESIVFPGTKDTKERGAILSEFRDIRKSISDKQSEKSKTIPQSRARLSIHIENQPINLYID